MYQRRSQGWARHVDFILWDEAALQAAFILAYMLRHGWGLPYSVAAYRHLAVMFFALDWLAAAAFDTMRGVMRRGWYREFAQTAKQALLVLAAMSLYLFSVQSGEAYSRVTVYLTAGFHLVIGYGTRVLWKRALRRFGEVSSKRAMVLVADEAEARRIIAGVRPTDGFEFSGVVLADRDAQGETVCGVRVAANLSGAAGVICRERVDEVLVCLDGGRADALIEQCRQMAIPVHVRLPILRAGGRNFVERVGGFDVLTLASNEASPLQMGLKRALDIAGGLVGSLMALAVMAAAGPRIKRESPGPILFKQTRVGLNGRKFRMYKIRTMRMDAEERKKDLEKENRVPGGMMFKLDFDPRIIGNEALADGTRRTGIGEFLRRTSLDEFPQFFNVLLGQMSLVGTRPPTVDEWERYQYRHRARLGTKPGITGLWQVSGRSRITDFEEVVRLDTEYIRRWSMGLDLRILLKTLQVVLRRDGAM